MKVIPYFTAPRLHDRVCQKIRKRFDDNLSWLDYSFPITQIGIIESKDNTETFPQVYANDGSNTYYDLRPDMGEGAYCFFELENTLALDEDDGTEYMFSVIFYARLDKAIPGDSNQDYTSKLIAEVIGELKYFNAHVLSWDIDPQSIFDKYSGLDQVITQSIMKMGTAFKITFTIWDGEDCY